MQYTCDSPDLRRKSVANLRRRKPAFTILTLSGKASGISGDFQYKNFLQGILYRANHISDIVYGAGMKNNQTGSADNQTQQSDRVKGSGVSKSHLGNQVSPSAHHPRAMKKAFQDHLWLLPRGGASTSRHQLMPVCSIELHYYYSIGFDKTFTPPLSLESPCTSDNSFNTTFGKAV
ncbi:hypothetical protein BTVI_102112 [Pitangus sulphuratus]|nr:hypothetical protein BTVI_102112 [Pitangus sulphuratus]